MTCGCTGNKTSQYGGAKKRKSTTTKPKSTTTKRKSTTTKRKSTKRRTTMRGGGEEIIPNEFLTGTKIPLRVQSSPDWVSDSLKPSSPPYAIDLGEAMQSYLFGRPTPDGKEFMVASGLVEKSKGVIDMVGGAKKRTSKKRTSKKRTSKKSTSKKSTTSTKKRRIIKK
jgi:hypothetical protein